MSLSSEHCNLDNPSEVQKCVKDTVKYSGVMNETERRLLQYAFELRQQVARTWAQHYGDRQSESPLTLSDVKKQDSRLECWMTPVRWVQQRGPNCGLAVLAMAARPVLACEVAAGGAADGGGATNNGRDKLHDEVQNAVMRSVYDAHIKKTPWPKHLHPPTLADLQNQAIEKGFSGRGEMFSAKAMANLAAEHQCGRYNVRLVEQSSDKESSFQQKTEDVDEEDDKIVDIAHCSLNYFAIELFDCTKVPPCSNKHNVLTTKLSTSTWKTNIVERLMNGNLIAVCFDCDKNMMPCSTNNGHTAHWGLLCGVVVEMSHTKPPTQQHKHCRNSNEFPNNFNPTDFAGKSQDSYPSVNVYGLDQIDHENLINSNDNIGVDVLMKDNSEKHSKSCTKLNLSNNLQALDPDRVWVVARHGKKGGRYAIWSLTELDSSNRQLRTPSDKILRTISPESLRKWEINLQQRKEVLPNSRIGEEKSVLIQQQRQETRDIGSSCHSVSPSYTTTASLFHPEKIEVPKLLSTIVPPLVVTCKLKNTKPLELASEKNLTVELKHLETLTTSLSTPPPPPPLPPSILKPPKIPYYVFKPNENNDKTPFVLPEGPRLDLCLACQFVAFEPVPMPFFLTDHVQYQLFDEDVKAHKLMSPLLCHFSFSRKVDI